MTRNGKSVISPISGNGLAFHDRIIGRYRFYVKPRSFLSLIFLRSANSGHTKVIKNIDLIKIINRHFRNYLTINVVQVVKTPEGYGFIGSMPIYKQILQRFLDMRTETHVNQDNYAPSSIIHLHSEKTHPVATALRHRTQTIDDKIPAMPTITGVERSVIVQGPISPSYQGSDQNVHDVETVVYPNTILRMNKQKSRSSDAGKHLIKPLENRSTHPIHPVISAQGHEIRHDVAVPSVLKADVTEWHTEKDTTIHRSTVSPVSPHRQQSTPVSSDPIPPRQVIRGMRTNKTNIDAPAPVKTRSLDPERENSMSYYEAGLPPSSIIPRALPSIILEGTRRHFTIIRPDTTLFRQDVQESDENISKMGTVSERIGPLGKKTRSIAPNHNTTNSLEMIYPEVSGSQRALIRQEGISIDHIGSANDASGRTSGLVLRKSSISNETDTTEKINKFHREKTTELETFETTTRKHISEKRTDEIGVIANRVYRILETRLAIEKERRGL